MEFLMSNESTTDLLKFILSNAEKSSPIFYDALTTLLKQKLSIEEVRMLLQSLDTTLIKFALSIYDDRFQTPPDSSFHQQTAEILRIDIDDLSSLTTVEEDEFRLMQGYEHTDTSYSTFFEFLRYHASLALTDPNPFIRTTAQRVINEYGPLPIV
jgi:hypothetical protein